jgi:hypothetical protein
MMFPDVTAFPGQLKTRQVIIRNHFVQNQQDKYLKNRENGRKL